MVNIFSFNKFNNVLLCATLITFSLNCTKNSYISAQEVNMNVRDSKLIYKVQDIISKIRSLENTGTVSEMVDLAIDLKQEIEEYLSIELDINELFESINSTIVDYSNNELNSNVNELKELIIFKEKERHDKLLSFDMCIKNNSFSEETLDLIYVGNFHKNQKQAEKKDEKSKCVPIRVAFGITLSLCGFLLCCLPIPPAKYYGKKMIEAGAIIALEGTFNHVDKEEDKKDDPE